MAKITCSELVKTIKGLSDKFASFHLSSCHCGAPVWQQPCPVCGFYPMYGELNSSMEKDACTLEDYQKNVDWKGNILEWYLTSFMRCVDPQEHLLAAAREASKDMEWPTADEIWHHFREVAA
jgi:hypothetical protein